MTDSTGNLTRWCLELSELDLEVVHSGGVKFRPADGLSRLTVSRIKKPLLDDDVPVLKITEAHQERERPRKTQKFGKSSPITKI